VLALTPVVWLYAAHGITTMAQWVRHRTALTRVAAALAVAVGIAPLAYDTLRYDWRLTLPDSRTLTKEWFEQNVPVGSVVYLSGGLISPSTITVPLSIDPALVDPIISQAIADSGDVASDSKSNFYKVLKQSLAKKKTYHLVLLDSRERLEESLDAGIGDWAVVDARTFPMFDDVASNRQSFPEQWRFLQWIRSDFELVKSFVPDGRRTTGPSLLVYRRKRSPMGVVPRKASTGSGAPANAG
jgi:hypothetical protein